MKKQEFIENLRKALMGKVDRAKQNEILQYYEEYIALEIKKGHTEEEVLASLGDPRLLAKSIADVDASAGESGTFDTAQGDRHQNGQNNAKTKGYLFGLPPWLLKLLILLVVIGIVVLVVQLLLFLAPVLITIAVAVFLYRLFFGRRGG